MKLFRINNLLTALRALIAWPLLIIGIYMLAALIGSHIPANSDWREPNTGIPIFVESNGVHVGLIVPISAAGEDLSDLVRPDQLSDPMLYGTHILVGWGHAGVFRHTKSWSDLRSGDALSATIGSDDVLLHVDHLINPQPTYYRKMLRVTPAQFRTIMAEIRGRFRLDGAGRSIASPGYSPDNIFYEAHGHYNAIHTCNTWTGDVLRKAGVRVGWWTPLAGGVMRWF